MKMARQAKTLKELAQVRADNRTKLKKYTGLQGTALGRKNFDIRENPEGDPCIIIYMPHKIHKNILGADQTIPKTLKSKNGKIEALTDIVVTTIPNISKTPPPLSEENQKLVNTLQWRDGKLDHIPPGTQVGFGDFVERIVGNNIEYIPVEAMGTIGYIVQSQKQLGLTGFLTNQHIGMRPGHSIYIPGFDKKAIQVGITRNVKEIIVDEKWLKGIDEPFAFVRTDCAFVEAKEKWISLLRNNIPAIGKVGEPYNISLDSMDIIGKRVKKVGRTTGLQFGTIVAFGYGVAGDSQLLDNWMGKEPANVYTDLMIAPREKEGAFSAPGDSGSPILIDSDDQENNKPVGLLWGGQSMNIGRSYGLEDLTFGINLQRILDMMELQLLR
jgi:hypothetical protein